jgi:hypothetical protein
MFEINSTQYKYSNSNPCVGRENIKARYKDREPRSTDTKPKSIVTGTRGRSNTFTGNENSERLPDIYNIYGVTILCAPHVLAHNSRIPNFSGTRLNRRI